MTEAGEIPRRGGGGWKLALADPGHGDLHRRSLAFQAHRVEDVVPDQHHLLTAVLLVLAVLMTLVGVVLSAWRWQRVLEVFDAQVPLRTLTTIYFASLFIGTVLPTTIGGDVLRVSRASSHRELAHRVRFGRTRTAHRIRRAAADRVVRVRDSSVAPRGTTVLAGASRRRDHAGTARIRDARRQPPSIRRPLRGPGELDPVHRRRAHRRRPLATSSPRKLYACWGPRSYTSFR